jgi:tetratricopeptide (TPR) repeat protein
MVYSAPMLTPAQKIVMDADAILEGEHSDPLLDWRDAAQMYLTAGGFGYGEAFAKLAYMYRGIGDSKYFKKDLDKSLSLYKKAVSLNHYDCLPSLAGLYLSIDEIDNFIKVWGLYFNNLDKVKNHDAVPGYVSICIERNLTYRIDERIKFFEKEIHCY